ncbi:MAG: UDP-2,3-diacylglucosamine diphosphatase LpxI [Lentisphaeria bacterium]|nr:UDP-2,3-diacylglucosamine diphosphatase LpxI [Lentisphaeria bacterium]NQZ66774.1 UDP-2,3-diacylglucosamine diphosphatase LpxI [Lentisphaeria bacterium]
MAEIKKIGLIAGRSRYPLLFAELAKQQGYELTVVAYHGETDKSIEEIADHVHWFYVGQLDKTSKAFQKHDVKEIVCAGQIKPGKLFKGMRPDFRTVKVLATTKEKNAATLFNAIGAEFEKDGLTVLPATTLLESQLADSGQMGKVKIKQDRLEEIEFGLKIVRESSRLNIGQTVVVKNGTVLAVEAFEGTDRAIIRGGELGHGDVTVVKIAKPGHDMRFDVPCIGLKTVESLKEAKAKTLAVQAGKTLFIDKSVVLDELNKSKIAVYGIDL